MTKIVMQKPSYQQEAFIVDELHMKEIRIW